MTSLMSYQFNIWSIDIVQIQIFRHNVRNASSILFMNSSSLGSLKDLYQGNMEDFNRSLAYFDPKR